MKEQEQIRLEILKMVAPTASRLGMDRPDIVVNKCRVFEQYVIGVDAEIKTGQDGDANQTGRRRSGRPKKVVPSN